MMEAKKASGIREPRSEPLSRRLDKMTGNLYVEKPEVFEEIVSDIVPDKRKLTKTYSNRPQSNSSKELQKELLRERLRLDAERVDKAMKENIEKSIQRNREKKDQLFARVTSDVAQCQSKLDEVDRTLQLLEETKKNKTRRQFEDWNTQVHGSIQMNIARQVNSLDSKALNKKKNEDYAKFLDVTNRKAAIFRDIIIESEYDPLEVNRRAIKATTQRLNDPCKIDAQKAAEEESMLPASPSRKTKPKLGKDTLSVELWATGKIEATPYGTFAKMMGSSEFPAARTTTSKPNPTRESHIVFDHFNYPKGKAALDPEMPRGKRVHPTTVYADPGETYGFNLKF